MILYKELGWSTYEPHPDAADLFERICDQDKLNEFEALLEETEGEYVNEGVVDDILRFEEDWVVDMLNLEPDDDEGEPWRTLDQSVFDDEDCPENTTCAAVDADGSAYWYICDPNDLEPYVDGWVNGKSCGIAWEHIGDGFKADDWEHSKIIREQKNV